MGLGFPTDAEALLLAEVDGGARGGAGSARAACARSSSAAARPRCASPRTSASARELWKRAQGRLHRARHHPSRLLHDRRHHPAPLPARRARRSVCALAKEYGLIVGNVFHAGDGNIHPCIFYDASVPGDLEKSEELGGRILELLHRGGRHDHRRARRGHREAAADVHAVPRARDRRLPRREARLRSRRASSIPARRCPRSSAAPSGAACTCATGACRAPTSRGSDMATISSPTCAERVRESAATKAPLRIRGGGTKDFYGGALAGRGRRRRALRGHRRLRAASELVLTVRAGTRARRGRGRARRRAPDARLRAAALRRRRRPSAARSPRASRARAGPTRARCATSCSARAS